MQGWSTEGGQGFDARHEPDSAPTDAQLVQDALGGDERALHDLVARHLPVARAIALGALREPADADDAVQEALVNAVTRLGQLRDPDRFRSWFVAITVNEVRQRMRTRRRRAEVPLDLVADEVIDLADPGDVAARRVDDQRARTRLAAASRWLSSDERRLLALWQLELSGDLERQELARLEGMTARHAAVSIHRLRRRLQDVVEICAALDQGRACPRLALLVREWDGSRSSVWRKRFGKHVQGCPTCKGAVAGADLRRLLVTTGLAAAPAAMVAGVLGAAKAAGVATVAGGAASAFPGRWVLASALLRPRVLIPSVAVSAGAGILVATSPWSAPLPAQVPPATSRAAVPAAGRPAPSPAPATKPGRPTASATPPPATVRPGYLVVATWGDDGAPGTAAAPLATLERALALAGPGQTIVVRGGVYRPTRPLVADRRTAQGGPVVVRSAPRETAVLDGTRLPAGSGALLDLAVRAWRVEGLVVRNSPGAGVQCTSCQDVRFVRLDVHDNAATGMVLRGEGTTATVVADSDFHRNHDLATKGENADGLEIRDGAGAGNRVERCRFFDNADDGLSLWTFASAVSVDSSWAWGNGVDRWDVGEGWKGNGVGFKLGGGEPAPAAAHEVVNSAAWDNRAQGFSANRNPAALRILRSTSYRNGQQGFWLDGRGSLLERAVSVEDRTPVRAGDGVVVRNNSWQGSRPDTTRFRSSSDAVAAGPRPTSGGLPASDFLVPTRTHAGASMRATPFP
ncbi:MAG: sigma-70 family RNA polymerase sigma factor [Kineosporiaceae bacterium]